MYNLGIKTLISWGALYVGAPVRPNMLNMPKSASGHATPDEWAPSPCANLIKIGPAISEITTVTAPFRTRRQKLAYPTKYFSKYWTNLHQVFIIARRMYVDY